MAHQPRFRAPQYGRKCKRMLLPAERTKFFRGKTPRKQPSHGSLRALMQIYDALCFWCRRPVSLTPRQRIDEATRDHLIPLSHGGPCNVKNMVLACWLCNVKRGNDAPTMGDLVKQWKVRLAHDARSSNG